MAILDVRKVLIVAIATIGYQGRTISDFIEILKKNRIDMVVDVRNNPFSRKADFSKKRLTEHLQKAQIEYLHIPELGIPSKERKEAKDEADWARLFSWFDQQLESKIEILERLIALGNDKNIVLMCLERNVDECHRGRIARRLERMKMEISHL